MNAKELHIKAILNGPDYFFCQRHNCTLRKCICAVRQHEQPKHPKTSDEVFDFIGSKLSKCIVRECQDCEQGAEIKKGFPNLKVERKRPVYGGRGRRHDKLPYPVREYVQSHE